ncbi:MAG: magnesium-translocating P-type ATPase [Rikenellaceae bacterium]|nr:magnesium-translocating P-type ATPase [Rikenellaceae bacterium]MCL2692546.1 magnesium-translocating P-type ATPase [Rikenellaceae bacterium]
MRPSFFRLVNKHYHSREITEKEKQITRNLIDSSSQSVSDIYQRLKTSHEGLRDDEIKKRRERYGPNVIVHEKKRPWWIQLLLAFNNPFNAVLFALALVSWLTHDYVAVTIIVVMVLISVMIKFVEEYKSRKGAEALRKMQHTTCTVERRNRAGHMSKREIPLEDLVPGDIITLAAGDIIPADVRIIHSKNLYISQSALTGESLPIEKSDVTLDPDPKANALDLKNICYMGTNVNVGSATAVVLATGADTYFGSMAQTLVKAAPPTAFDKGISKVSWLLIRFMAAMVPVVFFVTGFTKGDWLSALMFALSVAVGLTPEMLPMVVTSNLAKGAMKMAREKVIVKKLGAIQDFGAMNILCTDKTGTLTEDRIVLMRYTDVFLGECKAALRYAYLNSYFETGLKNLLDMAIVNNEFLADKETLSHEWHSIDELPFDFERRRMSVVLKRTDGHGDALMVSKGAIEEMLTCCTTVNTPDGERKLTAALRREIAANVASLNAEGLRVIAVGHRYFPQSHPDSYHTDEESELVLDGFMSFLDPPKESAREAIKALSENGIRVMVLTGDNDAVTRKVCSEVGLTDDRIILGSDIEELSDDEAYKLIEGHRIFAKLSPMQKGRIVRLLRGHDHVVGFMGDGINDTISLREADIGISVDTAVDIAKESADIILLQKSLMVLNQGVLEGRKTFANTMKYVKTTASSNFGNVLSLLGASVLFPFLPMLPLQILILNLLYDISQVSIPWDNVDAEYLRKPRKWKANDINRFMLIVGPTSSIFDYVTFAVLWFIVGANTVALQGVFQTGWFIESLFTQTLVVQILRTEKIPFFQSNASWIVMLSAFALLLVGVLLPYTGLGHSMGFAHLPTVFYLWLAAIVPAYCLLTQFVKRWYIKRYHSWI